MLRDAYVYACGRKEKKKRGCVSVIETVAMTTSRYLTLLSAWELSSRLSHLGSEARRRPFVAAKSLKRPDFMLPFSSFFSFYLLYTANMEMLYIDCMYGHMLRANDCKYLTCLSFSSYIASVWYLHAILDLTIILQRST